MERDEQTRIYEERIAAQRETIKKLEKEPMITENKLLTEKNAELVKANDLNAVKLMKARDRIEKLEKAQGKEATRGDAFERAFKEAETIVLDKEHYYVISVDKEQIALPDATRILNLMSVRGFTNVTIAAKGTVNLDKVVDTDAARTVIMIQRTLKQANEKIQEDAYIIKGLREELDKLKALIGNPIPAQEPLHEVPPPQVLGAATSTTTAPAGPTNPKP